MRSGSAHFGQNSSSLPLTAAAMKISPGRVVSGEHAALSAALASSRQPLGYLVPDEATEKDKVPSKIYRCLCRRGSYIVYKHLPVFCPLRAHAAPLGHPRPQMPVVP